MRLSFFTFNYLYDFKYCLDGTFLKIEKEKKKDFGDPGILHTQFFGYCNKKGIL